MKISKNWLNEWIEISAKSADEICAALNEIGLEVDACEQIKVADKVVVAKVLECADHENSDHLHVCKVDAGTGQILQIVCGAPNVGTGQMVACALEGAKIGEITIKKAKLRGVESCGMLCSARELGLGNINDGIMLLDESIGELEIGKELSSYPAFNDTYIEIELTPNRGDCLSIHGIARDLSAKFDLPLKERVQAKKSDDDLIGIGRLCSLHSEENKHTSLLYKALKLEKELKISLKYQLRLAMIESKAKLPLLAALDYITHSTGVILRAYDAGKLPKTDDKISITLTSQKNGASKIKAGNMLLSDVGLNQNKQTCVDENTKIALIEASYTDPEILANYSGENKDIQKDELSYRTLRGSEPALSLGINELCVKFLPASELYGGSQQINLNIERPSVLVNSAELSKMIGANIESKEIHRILARLNFEITASGEQFYAKVPNYRHDIQNIGDVCEEIVRILGIDNIPNVPLEFSEKNRINPTLNKFYNSRSLRINAAKAGYFECVHYVFDDEKELSELGFEPCKLKIVNPITNELSTLKPTLLNALLNSALNNAKRGFKSIKLFEYGEVFDKNGKQSSQLAFLSSGLNSAPSLLNSAKGGALSLFGFASDLQKILGKITLKKCQNMEFLSPFEQAEIWLNGREIGFIGRLKPNIKKDLPKTYVASIEFDKIPFESIKANAYSDFPAISRDLSLLVGENTSYEQIKKCISNLQIAELKGFYPVDLYSDKSLGDSKSLSLNFSFQSSQKTFTDDEINAFMDKIITALNVELGIVLR